MALVPMPLSSDVQALRGCFASLGGDDVVAFRRHEISRKSSHSNVRRHRSFDRIVSSVAFFGDGRSDVS